MSICPDCNGTGADAKKTADARKRGQCDSRSFIRCWSCHGNGNDTSADFMASWRRLDAVRSAPDYVPEFPPSKLIDDSTAGCVAAHIAICRGGAL